MEATNSLIAFYHVHLGAIIHSRGPRYSGHLCLAATERPQPLRTVLAFVRRELREKKTMITIIIIIITIINSNTLINVSLVGRPVSSARAPGKDYRFIDRRAILFVTVVDLGAIAIRLQWASCHRDRARQGTRSS